MRRSSLVDTKKTVEAVYVSLRPRGRADGPGHAAAAAEASGACVRISFYSAK